MRLHGFINNKIIIARILKTKEEKKKNTLRWESGSLNDVFYS